MREWLIGGYALIAVGVARRTAWHVYDEADASTDGVDWDALCAGLAWGLFAGLWWPVTVCWWVVKAGALRRGEIVLRLLTAIPREARAQRRAEWLEAREHETELERRRRERRIADLERRTGIDP